MHFVYFDSPLGRMGVFEENEKIVRVTLADGKKEEPSSPSRLAEQAAAQLSAYFRGKRKTFDLPLSFEKETPFRQSVYTQLLKIPYGKTATYRELADRIGKPKAARAVGGALHHNPLLILVPCHRIIGADGSLTGFAGGTDKKRFLLDLEQSNRK